METFYLEYKNELLGTGICLLVLLILKYLGTKAIQKVGKEHAVKMAKRKYGEKFENADTIKKAQMIEEF